MLIVLVQGQEVTEATDEDDYSFSIDAFMT
jgi:hypothetical protein